MKNILKHILNKKVFYVFLILMGCVLLSACQVKIDNDIEKTSAEMRSIRGCWSCQVFGAVYKAAGTVAEAAYENMRSVALNFLAVFLALWIAFKTLSFFMSLRVPNYTEYWVSLTGRIMRAIFAAAILANTQVMMKFINLIVEPVMLLFIYLSMRIIGANDQAFAVGADVNVGTAFADNPAFPAVVGSQLENLIYRIQVALDIGRGLGLRMIAFADLPGFLLGFVIVGVFFMLIFFFPYYFIDAILRLGFVIILFPIFVVAWVFDYPTPNASWPLRAWEILFSSMVQILIACIFVALVVSTVEGFTQLRGYNLLLNPIYQDASPYATQQMTRLSVSGLSFLILCFYMYALSKRTQIIAGFLTDVPATSIMAGMVEKAKSVAKAIVYAAIAYAAAAAGAAPVAAAMKKKAQEEAMNAITKNNG